MISARSYLSARPVRSGPTLAVPRPPAEWHFAPPIPFGSKTRAEPAPLARPPLEVVEADAPGDRVAPSCGPGDRPPLGAGVGAGEVDRRLADEDPGGRARERPDDSPIDDRREPGEHPLERPRRRR